MIDGLRRSGFEGHYPGIKGDMLDTVLGLETALRQFSNGADTVRSILLQVNSHLESVKLAVEKIGIEKKLVQLETLRSVVATATSAAAGAFNSKGASMLTLATIPIDIEIGALRDELKDLEEEATLHAAVKDIYDALDGLRKTMDTVADAYSQIQSGLSKLDQAQNKAGKYLADLSFLDSTTAGQARAVNTVMRRRQNTLRARYQTASLRARRLAYLGRRAIEFRLGVDMDAMDGEMTLVPKPSSWANRVCTMQGFNYERLRGGDNPLYDPDDPVWELDSEYQPQDDYRYWYIGDYVTLLEDFVESYNIDYPFTDETDLAVISIRDDYLKVRQLCQTESHNMLYQTGAVGNGAPVYDADQNVTGHKGWRSAGCLEDGQGHQDRCLKVTIPDPGSAVECDASFCFGENHELYINDPSLQPPGKATRLRDRPFDPSERPDELQGLEPANTGYVSQVVTAAAAGDHVLTWWNRLPVGATSVEYRVEVLVLGDSPGSFTDTFTPDATFVRQELRFHLEAAADLEIRFHPSHADDDPQVGGAQFGDVWLWGTQLEWIDPWRCRFDPNECETLPALPYEEVASDRMMWKTTCPDHDGSQMRSRFRRECICPDSPQGVCPPGSEGISNRYCYWYLPIEIPLSSLESGELIPSHNIAAHNFNYRHDEIAVNVVGTNVRSCEHSETPTTCAVNAFVPYTLDHFGVADVSSWEGSMSYSLPLAKVEHGKALAAEVLVTNPPSSTHTQLLGPYYKSGLRGRPLTGSYLLRIWETSELNWQAVEDIQLVWRYRYWTRIGGQ